MPHRNNVRIVAGACLTVVLLALLALGGLACYQWGRAAERGDQVAAQAAAQQVSTDVAGCRASYRAELIDLPTTRALRASARKDDPGFQDAVSGTQIEDYQRVLELSQRDPEAFLRQCRAEGRAG